MEISLLHPTFGRPEKSKNTTQKWLEKAGCEVELIVCLSVGDLKFNTYKSIYPNALEVKKNTAVDAINECASKATGRIMIVLSDDTDCPDNWGPQLLKSVEGKEDFVLKVDDGIQPWIVTMPVIDRTYYNRFNYIYHPEYKHLFCDTEFTHVADCLKKIIVDHDLKFPHRHYSITKERRDDTNRKCDSTWDHGKALYMRRAKSCFGLNVDIWDIGSQEHKNWMKKAGIR